MVVATGIYTIFGGLAAVIYTEFMQAVVLLGGAITLTVIGLVEVGGMAGLRAGAAAGLLPHDEAVVGSGVPVDRHLLRRADPRHLVLVHRPDDRAARARREERRRRARRRAAVRPAEDAAGVRAGAAGADRARALSGHQGRRCVSDAGGAAAAGRHDRADGGGPAGGADVLALGDVQLGVDADHLRRLQEAEPGRERSAPGRRRPELHGRDGRRSASCGCRSSGI